ncbi:TPX2 protein [Thecamonas trahens ATCC 50062]|uniref:TPX2 protein n=1 Tax=Thecamonas trahens ATCC 50062 TaxID=461836 RepID=A0A0L0D8F1_THETB|nr:TPX2 protein [Thecamonas trahens ATCC 50062]KNC48609.1 TPX2 protein [Thecamonas trahens ATCC 50062]|eukprot:XP_013762665.1 TPX2 protein [Thecamonas trahens ATCC 50062]
MANTYEFEAPQFVDFDDIDATDAHADECRRASVAPAPEHDHAVADNMLPGTPVSAAAAQPLAAVPARVALTAVMASPPGVAHMADVSRPGAMCTPSRTPAVVDLDEQQLPSSPEPLPMPAVLMAEAEAEAQGEAQAEAEADADADADADAEVEIMDATYAPITHAPLIAADEIMMSPLKAELPSPADEPLALRDIVAENIIAEDVIAEDVIAEDVIADDVIAEDVIAETVEPEAATGSADDSFTIMSASLTSSTNGPRSLLASSLRSRPIRVRKVEQREISSSPEPEADTTVVPASAAAPAAASVRPKTAAGEPKPRPRAKPRAKPEAKPQAKQARRQAARGGAKPSARVPRFLQPTAAWKAREAARAAEAKAEAAAKSEVKSGAKAARKRRPKTSAGRAPRFSRPTVAWKAREEAVESEAKAEAKARSSHRPRTAPALTVPKTPAFQRRERAKPKTKALTSEELELHAIREARAELKRQMVKNRKRAARPKKAPVSKRSVKPLTEPVAFRFHTDSRIKSKPAAESPRPAERSKRLAGVRKAKVAATQPRPFHFASDKGPIHASASFVSTAEAVNAFLAKTPTRFKTKPAPMAASRPLQLTIPVTPKFATDALAKREKHAVLSTEDAELEAIKAHPGFKARPVNAKIFESCGDYGVPKVARVKPTRPITPTFASDSRIGRRTHDEPADPPSFTFKARPVPRSVYKAPPPPAGPVSAIKSLTIPHSPALATKDRASRRPEPVLSDEPPRPKFKAGLMPVFDSPEPLPTPKRKPLTVPVPFELASDVRGAKYRARIEAEREAQAAAAAAAAKFKATPLLDLETPDPLPRAAPKELTVPIPFELESVKRHEAAEASRAARIAAELEAEAAQFSSFAAKPAPAHDLPVFTPRRSAAPLTETQPFDLNTSRRAEEREAKAEVKAAEDAVLEAERAAMAAARAREEAEELAEFRKSLDFKAQPIRHYAPIRVKVSEAQLTVPVSPQFRTSKRSKLRA